MQSSLTCAVLVTLLTLPSCGDGQCWFRDAQGRLQLLRCEQAFIQPFALTRIEGDHSVNSSEGEWSLTWIARNTLLAWSSAMALPLNSKAGHAFLSADPLASVVMWLGRLEELQG